MELSAQAASTSSSAIDRRRIIVFLAFAFGIAWVIGLIVFLTGGIVNSPPLIAGSNLTLAFVLIAFGYMFAPAISSILTRLVTGEGFNNMKLGGRLRTGWPYWLAAWILPAILIILGAAVYFLVFPDAFDPQMTQIWDSMEAAGQPIPYSPAVFAVIQTIQAVLLSPLINLVFTMGEELGWRGYLQPKLMPLGGRKTMLLIGLIWGVWHWPVILMGHNYGLDYPGAPFLGPVMMVLFCIVWSIILGWLTLRGGSVWPAAIGHAALNGIAAIGLLFLVRQPDALIGPMPTGILGMLPGILLALALWLSPRALRTED